MSCFFIIFHYLRASSKSRASRAHIYKTLRYFNMTWMSITVKIVCTINNKVHCIPSIIVGFPR